MSNAVLDALSQVGWLSVGTGGGVSAQYPVVSVVESERLEGTDLRTMASQRVTTWRLRCLSCAATTAGLATHKAAVIDDLSRRGDKVTLSEYGASRSLPAAGVTAAASIPGYPRVTVDFPDDAMAVGPWLPFDVTVETRRPAFTGTADHVYTVESSVDGSGRITTTQRGSVRTTTTIGSALSWVEDNVFADPREQAEIDGLEFTTRTTVGSDPAACEYEWRSGPPASGQAAGGNPVGIFRAEVTDRSARSIEAGRIERTVSGYAEGSAAASYAQSKRPTGSTFLLTDAEVSTPRYPDGRVEFTYKGLDGLTIPGTALVVYAFSEQWAETAGGRPIGSATYLSGVPVLYLGAAESTVLQHTVSVEFNGDPAAMEAYLAPILDAAHLSYQSGRPRRGKAKGRRTLDLTRVYVFDGPVDLPTPDPLEAAL